MALSRMPPPRYLMLGIGVLLFFVLLRAGYSSDNVNEMVHRLPSAIQGSHTSGSDVSSSEPAYIPNIVHYVHLFNDENAEFTFLFRHFLSIYAAWLHWQPDTIYLHTNARPEAVEDARSGKRGKWNKYIFNMPNLIVNHVVAPDFAENGVKIERIEHKSDLVRLDEILKTGGAYIDWDVMVLRDIKPMRESGFNAIVGHQPQGQINSGIFLAKPHSKLMQMWRDDAHKIFDGGWVTHSNELIDKLSKRMTRLPGGEVLIAEQDAFSPGAWRSEDDISFRFPEVHDDVPSNLENWTEGDPLPVHEENFSDRWDHPDRFPDWDLDYSTSYMVHCFNIRAFQHVTPRYVLERKSRLSRNMYVVAKHMYDAGLIRVDDSHESAAE